MRAQKTGLLAGFRCSDGESASALSECAHLPVEAALVAGSLVFVYQALVGHPVDDRHGSLVAALGSFLVASVYGVDDFLDRGAQHAALSRLLLAAFLGLAGTLAGLC